MGFRLTTVMAVAVVAGTTVAGWHHGSPPRGAAAPPSHARQAAAHNRPSPTPTPASSPTSSASATPAAAATGSPALSTKARRSCPAAASACVDLSDHLTWLQSGGHITYGPVRMEPGPPGTRHATPRGTFHVQWKAGADYISTEYHEPMPYAVFFAPGGVAFHGGSLTKHSHGCVHLSRSNAQYYHAHLPIGAEVVVS
jgi:lipoprotein-anchoring transpeptidase ErfK/SrfK